MKVIFTKNGKGYLSPRITLKNKDLEKMKVTPDRPEVKCTYIEELEGIIIKRAKN